MKIIRLKELIAHDKLGNKRKAKTLLENLVKKKHLTEKAPNLLSTLNLSALKKLQTT